MDKVLDQLLDGTFDISKSKQQLADAQAIAQKRADSFKEVDRSDTLYKQGKKKEALAILKKIGVDFPDMAQSMVMCQFCLLIQDNKPAATKLAEDFMKDAGKPGTADKGANICAEMASSALRPEGGKKPSLTLAKRLSDRAVQLLGKNQNCFIWDVAASIYAEERDYKHALAAEVKALTAVGKDGPAALRHNMSTRIKEYQAKVPSQKAEGR
jgi:hypothetical protein